MVPTPTAIGLWTCDQIIIDRETVKPSLIGIFTGLAVESFPSDPQRFSVFSSLIDGEGRGRIEVTITSDESGEMIHTLRSGISIPDRLTAVNAAFRLRRVQFPESGVYSIHLLIDGELIAQRRIRVYTDDAD